MSARPKILSISFSEFVTDARVLRQLSVLESYGDVTTLGYGPRPAGAVEHLEIPRGLPSLPQTPIGVFLLALRQFDAAALAAPAVKAALKLLGERKFDLIVANEARALPLADAVAHGAPVWGDMHEWAPGERTHVWSWRILVAPFMRYVCRRFLPHTAAVSTVNESIAQLYGDQFGVDAVVVRNALPFNDLQPSAMRPGRIRLVHSGAAVPGRNIEVLIDTTLQLDSRFTLDLYLVAARDGGRYLKELRRRAGSSERVTFHDAVPPGDLAVTLNAYDVGVFSLPPRTINHLYMLPNKFFDFVQARLAVVFATSVETDRLIQEHGLGLIASGFDVESLYSVLDGLNGESVMRFKGASDAAAHVLSSVRDRRTQCEIVERLLAEDKGPEA